MFSFGNNSTFAYSQGHESGRLRKAMGGRMQAFKDRYEAGRILSDHLKEHLKEDVVVLALPRGGVPIGREIAHKFKASLDILPVKKIGAPHQPEYAIGALTEDGHVLWNQEAIDRLHLKPEVCQALSQEIHKDLIEKVKMWRPFKALNIQNKSILIVDDGLATGFTMKAAVDWAHRQGARKIFVATPIAPRTSFTSLMPHADRIFVVQQPEHFFSVGHWYKNFLPVSDQTVRDLLTQNSLTEREIHSVRIPVLNIFLSGEIKIPPSPKATVVFAHGTGSNYQSPRNQLVADRLAQRGFATLLFDLLTPHEATNRRKIFNIPLLSSRLLAATRWLRDFEGLRHLPIGYFGSSTGAAAALVAAARDQKIFCLVSRGGRPDMAAEKLPHVRCPVLLLVGGKDEDVIRLNESAKKFLKNAELKIIPHAGHLFEEPGTLEKVVEESQSWFSHYLRPETEISSGNELLF